MQEHVCPLHAPTISDSAEVALKGGQEVMYSNTVAVFGNAGISIAKYTYAKDLLRCCFLEKGRLSTIYTT